MATAPKKPATPVKPAARPAQQPAKKPAAAPAQPAKRPTAAQPPKAAPKPAQPARRPAPAPAPEPEPEVEDFSFDDEAGDEQADETEDEIANVEDNGEYVEGGDNTDDNTEGDAEAGTGDDQFDDAEADPDAFDENAETDAEAEDGFAVDVDTSDMGDDAEMRSNKPAAGTYHLQIVDCSRREQKPGKMGGFMVNCSVLAGMREDGKPVKNEIGKMIAGFPNVIPKVINGVVDEKNAEFARIQAGLWSRVLGFTSKANPKGKLDFSKAVGRQFIGVVVEGVDQNNKPQLQLDTMRGIYNLYDPEVRDVPKDKNAMIEAGYKVPGGASQPV